MRLTKRSGEPGASYLKKGELCLLFLWMQGLTRCHSSSSSVNSCQLENLPWAPGRFPAYYKSVAAYELDGLEGGRPERDMDSIWCSFQLFRNCRKTEVHIFWCGFQIWEEQIGWWDAKDSFRPVWKSPGWGIMHMSRTRDRRRKSAEWINDCSLHAWP